MPDSEQAAAEAAAKLIADDEAAGENTEQSGTEETNEVQFPDFNIALPADLAAELEEGDVDLSVDDDDDDLEALVEQHGEENRDLAKQLLSERRKSAHYEQLRAKADKKNWAVEAQEFFPLAEPFLTEINSTSRRGYLRTAKQIHEKMMPIVEEKVLKPARDAIERTKTETKTEAKEEARAAWGQPVSTEENRPPSEAQVSQQVAHARKRRGDLADSIRSMMFPNGE